MEKDRIQEMIQEINHYCNSRACEDCPYDKNDSWCFHFADISDLSYDSIVHVYDELFKNRDIKPEKLDKVSKNDVIKHPKHYCRDGAMECIDEMKMIFGKEAVKHFCLCNIWKYRYRSGAKNGEEDTKKSDQYVRIYKELCDGE